MVSSMAASLAGGYLVDKMGALSFVSLVNSIPAFLVTTIILGFGMGIVIGAPLNILILQAVEHKETGAAVGYLSLFRSLGSTIGPTVAGYLLATFTTGFNILFLLSATLSMISIMILMIFIQKK
ncbi:MFS transporter [Ammoniphilus sp. 3BR4]|uniref:MFS transporter n=1 Tax=Ammoniphilus sp. 3BR4 TaxID=3158265 RepID=UPI0034671969